MKIEIIAETIKPPLFTADSDSSGINMNAFPVLLQKIKNGAKIINLSTTAFSYVDMEETVQQLTVVAIIEI